MSDDRTTPCLSVKFKREAAGLVLDQAYSHMEASCSLGVVESALRHWVNQLQQERNGVLMRELGLISKEPDSHAYSKATVERPNIQNIPNREFDVPATNQVWCGDITYIWEQGKWRHCADGAQKKT